MASDSGFITFLGASGQWLIRPDSIDAIIIGRQRPNEGGQWYIDLHVRGFTMPIRYGLGYSRDAIYHDFTVDLRNARSHSIG